jgi:quinol-cytochrome oxidoreductase complex cytochrome b subunit
MRFVTNFELVSTVYRFLFSYPVYQNISYWWSYGVLAGFCMTVQIITGIFLAMHYVPHADLAFLSVEHIMRDVNYGWLIRYIHANGASFFFLTVYIHVFRNLHYVSYLMPRYLLWSFGVAILFLMILTAFMGYVLPWGQMSFWAATVITNLCSAIPIIGGTIVVWLWGGYSVDNATLNRFFSFHYFFPFVIVFLVLLHLIALHSYGSTNPLGSYLSDDKIPFHPYFVVKDAFSVLIFFQIFLYFVFFMPNLLGHPDNYIPANPLVTPSHIVPEWYFLPFYAILRSVPHKLGGVIVMMAAILILFLLPFAVHSDIKRFEFYYIRLVAFWFFFNIAVLLGWIGGNVAEGIYILVGQLLTFFYFGYFLFLIVLSNVYCFNNWFVFASKPINKLTF